jgi:hypothetical protein
VRAQSALFAVSLLALPSIAQARFVKSPNVADIKATLGIPKTEVKNLHCSTKRFKQPALVAGTSKCSFSRRTPEARAWKFEKLQLKYTGVGCGDEGQEADLICYNWSRDDTSH